MESVEGAMPEVDLPDLPDDEELRRQVNVQPLFDLVRRYAYSGQSWEALEEHLSENVTGLYALAVLLEAKSLAEAAFAHLERLGLGPIISTRLLYIASLLQGSGEAFSSARERCQEVVRLGFGTAIASPTEAELICKMPFDILISFLEAEDLEVPNEGVILQIARRVLWRRMSRKEQVLSISGARLDAPELLSRAGTFEATILEDLPADFCGDISSFKVAKYAAATAAGEGVDIQDVSMRYPVGSVGPGHSGVVLVQLKAADGEVLVASSLPVDQLQAGPEEVLEAEAYAQGQLAGKISFRWQVSAAPEPPAEAADEGTDEAAPKPRDSSADSALSEEEANRILCAVRFAHLEHKELLEAVKDPVLLEAGAQQQVLTALSSRLSQYEQAGEDAPGAQAPRPSTLREPKAPPPPPSNQAVLPEVPALEATVVPAAISPPETGRVGSGMLSGASTGTPLFPCGACGGRGRMQLKQQEMRWCVRCSKHSSCQHMIWLPSCVMAAAVDGHCAACALRLGAEVRTLTIRVGRQHSVALSKLPGGVDTLRGMCIAGCNDTLSLLGD
eukprot:CAMPEP_0197690192 /NCGR_PEP_ID=MMETSP1338-20131121/107998_1 /TAXON_ID=43686 ORGANISM="Pelagodinium beii, Strain RCC1491" /NCGR_SAMPLE_ID=MMETSP1338 /ASSEMBLY_ACC=CAM_ASM_000754 /LENGTH=559 /DNA_ID=CAMNT_0043272613 /DNA_START=66 /DNA_END=1745 /DNA_ORIENTATION=+